MSVIATKLERSPIVVAVSAALGFTRKAAVKIGHLLVRPINAVAEVRMQRTQLEAELYLNRYRHTSKNDDDLPVVR